MSTSKRILIVEDEMLIALHIEDTLTQLGHQVVTAITTSEAERIIAGGDIELALVDYKLTDGNSEALMGRLQAAGVPFIVCSGISDDSARGSVSRQAPFLSKPFTSDALIDAVSALTGIRKPNKGSELAACFLEDRFTCP